MLGLSLPLIITRVITLVIAFSFHEFSHAAVANAFGDDTAKRAGRLTLNPIAHLDLFGTLLLIVAGFGWAKPVPVNPYQLQRKSPAALMWVSLAGPMSNFLLAILAAIPLRFEWVAYTGLTSEGLPTLYEFLFYFIVINLSLMLFNLIPIAPLDGEKIAEYVLPPSWGKALEKIAAYGPMVLMLVFFIGPRVGLDIFSGIITPVLSNLLSLMLGYNI